MQQQQTNCPLHFHCAFQQARVAGWGNSTQIGRKLPSSICKQTRKNRVCNMQEESERRLKHSGKDSRLEVINQSGMMLTLRLVHKTINSSLEAKVYQEQDDSYLSSIPLKLFLSSLTLHLQQHGLALFHLFFHLHPQVMKMSLNYLHLQKITLLLFFCLQVNLMKPTKDGPKIMINADSMFKEILNWKKLGHHWVSVVYLSMPSQL